MASTINLSDQIDATVRSLPSYDNMLGRTLMQPFRPANSGSRALMNSVHAEQHTVLNHAEVPLIQTGYETEFGKNSSSYVRLISEDNENRMRAQIPKSKFENGYLSYYTDSPEPIIYSEYKVLHKIEKFKNIPGWQYYLIIQNLTTGEYDLIERVSYNHNTESYGYLWDNSKLDKLKVGDYISEGDVLKTSIGFDEYGNKMNGVNLTTLYMSCAQNMEDSVIISESAAKKLETSLVKKTPVTINDNDVLLNLYGNETLYKTFPDIGEEVKNGIFCSIRRIENENILYTLSQQNLRDIMLSDRNILMEGKVADISIYCNNPEALGDSHYNAQLFYYYNQNLEFCKEVNDIVGPLAMTSKLSYRLKKFYARCRDVVAGKQFFKEKLFNHVIMEITVIQNLPMQPGDKMADRYGGKGVISLIMPDEMMPILDSGRRVEVIKNQSTCINRENIGQLHEQSLSFIAMRILDYFRLKVLTYPEMAQMWYKFVSMVDKDQAASILQCFNLEDEYETKLIIDSILDDDGIILSIPPFTAEINDIDAIARIYDEFPFIKQYDVRVPMKDSNGNVRMVKTLRPMVASKIYNYRLKQYAEEKFSVTSLSATNLKNLNTRSKANKMYEAKFTKTPIMFGFMESGDMMHLGVQYVVMNLMLYSSSPQGRRLVEQLLIGDPYDIDIKLDHTSKNRNAEIINALFETMGLRLSFQKIPKQKKFLAMTDMVRIVPPRLFKPKTRIRDVMGRFDELELMYKAAMTERQSRKPLVGKVMCKKVGEVYVGSGKYATEDDPESDIIDVEAREID